MNNEVVDESRSRFMIVDLLHRQSHIALLATVINTSIFAYLSWNVLAHSLLLIWYVVFLTIATLRYLLALKWKAVAGPELSAEQVRLWKFVFDGGVFVSGILWGLLGINVYPGVPVEQQVLSAFLLAGISSGAVVSYSSSARTVILSVLPMLAPLTIGLLWSAEPAYVGMAAMVMLYTVLMVRLGGNLAAHHARMISLSLERATLMTERNALEAASHAKSMFLARVSHEIRTPLAAIIGFADRLLRAREDFAVQRRNLQAIFRSGTHLLSLVNDFLDLARIESGQVLIEKNWFSPQQEIATAMGIAKPMACEKALTLDIRENGKLPGKIYSDPKRFRQIVINLLTNAIKYTEKGTITLETEVCGRLLHVRVIDTGHGIESSFTKQIFEPFMRAENQRGQAQGTGIGLTLAQELARSMGGNLWLAKSEVGVGSVFEFSVDIEAPKNVRDVPLPPSETVVAQQMLSQEELLDWRILVAEDDTDLQELIRWNLESAGAFIDMCANGAEAVDRAMAASYDLVLLDIQMPVMDGYAAAQKLRHFGYQKPIVALTAHASIEDKQRCLEAGCSAYVSKPFEPESLIQTVRRLGERASNF